MYKKRVRDVQSKETLDQVHRFTSRVQILNSVYDGVSSMTEPVGIYDGTTDNLNLRSRGPLSASRGQPSPEDGPSAFVVYGCRDGSQERDT